MHTTNKYSDLGIGRGHYHATHPTQSSLTTFADRGIVCPVLVGRQGPLVAASGALSRSQNGQGGIVLISGEAGIGKSRFLREVAGQARARGFVVLLGACFEADRAIPYAPLLDLVRGFASSTSAAVAAHAFAPAAIELVRAFPELASVFGDVPAASPLDPQHERRLLFHAIAAALESLAHTQPVLVTIEDLQWADEASIELLAFLSRRIGTQRIAFALNYRSDEIHPPLQQLLIDLNRARITTDIALARFSSTEFATMLAAIFDDATPGSGFAERLHKITDGNPFFAEEVLKSLVSSGELSRQENGTWRANTLSTVQPPRTAVEAVRRRLSALTVSARDVASMAAVAGRRFDFVFLQALTGHDERTLLALIRELIAAQLVVEETPDRFAFRHALTREALLGELLTRERAALHRIVADELQRTLGDSDANIEALAYHAYGAMDWERALETSRRAAQHAMALHAPREALMHLDRALDAANRAGIAPDSALHLARGQACEFIGNWRAANENFLAALNASRLACTPAATSDALYALGMLWAARDYKRAGEYRREALAVARSINDPRRIAHSLNRVANWHVNLERPARALPDHYEALALFEKLGDPRGIAETVDLLALTHFVMGNSSEATARLEHAITLHRALDDARGEANALALLMMCSASMHASAAAFGPSPVGRMPDIGERAIQRTRDIGWLAGETFALYLTADAAAWRGDYERALRLARESLANAEASRHLQWECGAVSCLGLLLLDLQSPERALVFLERAHDIATRLGNRSWLRWSAASLAQALAALGKYEAAHTLLDDAQVAANPDPDWADAEPRQVQDPDEYTLGLRNIALARAEVALAEGDVKRALSIADEYLAKEQRANAQIENYHLAAKPGAAPRWTFVRARALLANNQHREADNALQDAMREAEATDAQPLLWRIHATNGTLMLTQRKRREARLAFNQARDIAAKLASRVDEQELRDNFLRGVDRLAPAAPTPTQRQKEKKSFGGLTSRERDVARLVTQGNANRAIARALSIGERTVEGYVSGALAKLGLSTRSQLAAWTVERGLGGS